MTGSPTVGGRPRAAVLYGRGWNADREMAMAFRMAGADAERVHISDLLKTPKMLRDFDLLGLPGGFTYGDHIAAGVALARDMIKHADQEVTDFIEAGKPTAAVCNGAQIGVNGVVKSLVGAKRADEKVPEPEINRPGAMRPVEQQATLTYNKGGTFVYQDVRLAINPNTKCLWVKGMTELKDSVRHGMGRYEFAPGVLEALKAGNQLVAFYADPDGNPTEDKRYNPNGSQGGIASITNEQGNLYLSMPHPEEYLSWVNDPQAFRAFRERPEAEQPKEGPGILPFRNAVRAVTGP